MRSPISKVSGDYPGSPEQAAQIMVANSNTVVQLAQQGMPPMQVSEADTRLQQAVLQALPKN